MVQIEGNRMISQSLKDIRLWDLENANCVLSIPTSTYSAESGRCFQFQGTHTHTHTHNTTHVLNRPLTTTVGRAGNRLVSGSDIGSIHEWDLRTGKLVSTTEYLAGRTARALAATRIFFSFFFSFLFFSFCSALPRDDPIWCLQWHGDRLIVLFSSLLFLSPPAM